MLICSVPDLPDDTDVLTDMWRTWAGTRDNCIEMTKEREKR